MPLQILSAGSGIQHPLRHYDNPYGLYPCRGPRRRVGCRLVIPGDVLRRGDSPSATTVLGRGRPAVAAGSRQNTSRAPRRPQMAGRGVGCPYRFSPLAPGNIPCATPRICTGSTPPADYRPSLRSPVRHEVARVFIREIKIRCSATGTLPGRALGVTPGCEALGTL